ncbi:hypothetical protein LPTSP3_g32780 [Leptospira kobayashii]|uniref:Lipoprotein n=1 Tax=Leptospira kobayashii TaxID=1917830 RepID=A0ABM7UMN6_9LEPT|nr:hypothetical protein [Leptospira kobayashii]BDA80348.1 hypothetical protein LPTSP3_g32780 [Leptospira kobayashii]
MLFRAQLSLLIAAILLFQAVFLNSGLFGYCLEDGAKICECNHGSRKELHKNPEDEMFSKERVTVSSHDDHKHGAKILPSCHSAKSGETHLCSCKKNKSQASSLRNFHQTWNHQTNSSEVSVQYDILFSVMILSEIPKEGFDPSPFFPPKT